MGEQVVVTSSSLDLSSLVCLCLPSIRSTSLATLTTPASLATLTTPTSLATLTTGATLATLTPTPGPPTPPTPTSP